MTWLQALLVLGTSVCTLATPGAYSADASPVKFTELIPLTVADGSPFNVSFLEVDHRTSIVGILKPGVKFDLTTRKFIADPDPMTNTMYWSYYMRTLFAPVRAFVSTKEIHSELIHPGFNRVLLHTRDTPNVITEVAGFPESKGAVSATIQPNVPVMLDLNADIKSEAIPTLAVPATEPRRRGPPDIHSVASPTETTLVIAGVGALMSRDCTTPPPGTPPEAFTTPVSVVYHFTLGASAWEIARTQCVWAVYSVNATNSFIEVTADNGKPIAVYLSDGSYFAKGIRVLNTPAGAGAAPTWTDIENDGAQGGIVDLDAHKMLLELPGVAEYTKNGRTETPVTHRMGFFIHTRVRHRNHDMFHLTIAFFTMDPGFSWPSIGMGGNGVLTSTPVPVAAGGPMAGAPVAPTPRDEIIGQALTFRYGNDDNEKLTWTLKSRPQSFGGMVMTSIQLLLEPDDGGHEVRHAVWLGGQQYGPQSAGATMLRFGRTGGHHLLFGICGGTEWVTPGPMVAPAGVCVVKMDFTESYVYSTANTVGTGHGHRGMNWVHWVPQSDEERNGWMSAIVLPDAAPTLKFPGLTAPTSAGYFVIGAPSSESSGGGSSASIIILIVIIIIIIVAVAVAIGVYFGVVRRKSPPTVDY